MSDWNVQTLREHFNQRFLDSDKAIQTALVAQEKAIIKAENAAEKRFDLLNELRVGVATKDQLDALEKVVNELKERLTSSEGAKRGSGDTWKVITAIIGVGIAILGFIGFKAG